LPAVIIDNDKQVEHTKSRSNMPLQLPQFAKRIYSNLVNFVKPILETYIFQRDQLLRQSREAKIFMRESTSRGVVNDNVSPPCLVAEKEQSSFRYRKRISKNKFCFTRKPRLGETAVISWFCF